jgi:hypothetical protein
VKPFAPNAVIPLDAEINLENSHTQLFWHCDELDVDGYEGKQYDSDY